MTIAIFSPLAWPRDVLTIRPQVAFTFFSLFFTFPDSVRTVLEIKRFIVSVWDFNSR